MKYAVITTKNIHGHGYPAHTESVQEFKPFKTEEEMKSWIEKNHGVVTFTAIRYEELTVTKEVKFTTAPVTRHAHP